MPKDFPLFDELRANFRLRLGAWLIAVILAGYGLLLLHDYRRQLQSDYRGAAQRLEQLQNIATQTAWPQRATESRNLLVELQGKLWEANSKGLAQAVFQNWLDYQIRATKLDARAKAEAAFDVADLPHVWRVAAQIEGSFSAEGVENLFLGFAKHTQWVIVENLQTQQTRSPRFTLTVVAYFRAPREAL